MFCPRCGQSVPDDSNFCPRCGQQNLPVTAAAPGATPVVAVPAPLAPQSTSGLAIASLLCGILFIFILPAILAVIFGHLALSQIKKGAGRIGGHGVAIAGLVLGYAGVAFIPIVLIIAAIAIPNLLRARIAANEASAMGSVRTIVTAEITYAAGHEQEGYACSFSDLRDLLGESLATGTKSGYAFELQGCTPPTSDGGPAKFQVVAHPLTPNTTGVRAFCSDESGVVRFDASGSAQNCLENGSELR